MKNEIQKFITNNFYKLLCRPQSKTILNNHYQSIPNISYKLLSDKPFQIILTNYYQTSEAAAQTCSVKKPPATLLKKRLWHRCFPVNFAKFLKTPFFTEHLWWLLLKHYLVLLSDNSFQAIFIQTFIWELLKQHLQTYYQRIISSNI